VTLVKLKLPFNSPDKDLFSPQQQCPDHRSLSPSDQMKERPRHVRKANGSSDEVTCLLRGSIAKVRLTQLRVTTTGIDCLTV